MKTPGVVSLISLILLPGCAFYHDLKNPERISSTSLDCKTRTCLSIAEKRIQTSSSLWLKLKENSKGFVLESSHYPMEGTPHGSTYMYKRGELISSEEWVEKRENKKVTRLGSVDPFDELIQKCLKLASTSELAPHRYYCFAFSTDGLLLACGQYGYWPRWEDATCLGEKFQVRDVRK